MTYHPPPPREPSGCIQTLVISRMIFQILAIPIVLILGALISVLLLIFAFNESPLLGLFVIAVVVLLVYLAIKWERARIEREHPDIPPDDPRTR